MNLKKRLKKNKPKPKETSDNIEWWKEDYIPPTPPKTDLKNIFKPKRQLPKPTLIGFKRILALILAGIYGIAVALTIESMLYPSPFRTMYSPELLLLIIPTIWILLSYIKTAGRRKEEE